MVNKSLPKCRTHAKFCLAGRGRQQVLGELPRSKLGTKMVELTASVSWLAVIVGAVLAFLLGWLWYSPKLFGTKWAEGSKVELGNATDMPMVAMATQALGLIGLAWVVAITAATNSLLTIILITISFVLLQWSGNSFTQKNNYAKMVDGGYWIAAVVVMIAVQMVL